MHYLITNTLNINRTLLCYLFLGIYLFASPAWSQTKGIIFDPAEGAGSVLLDPNGDGFVSAEATGFSANDESESEISYIAIPTAGTEGDGDVSHGASCSYIDFVNTTDTEALYFYSDGVYLFFRFRIGGSSNSSKTYSVFIDTDEKYGFSGNNADPNAVTGNPGFEIELSLHTNRGIGIYNVDGNVDPSGNEVGNHAADRPADEHSQRSVALTEVCGDDDYFYDFYVAFADFGGLIDFNTTKMRMVAQSGISANPIIGTTSGTDLGGVDDDSGNGFDLIEDMIDDFPPITGSDLAGGGPILHRATCPGIDDPIAIGATSVSGTSSEEGATITVYVDGGSPETTTVTGGIWTATGFTSFSGGEVITATAEIPDIKSVSEDNCNPVMVNQTCSESPTITGEVSGGTGKGLFGTSNEEGAIVSVWTDAGLSNLWTGADAGDPNPGEVGVGGSTSTMGEWQVSGGANNLSNGVYYVTVENSPSECESEPAIYCNGVGGSTPPVITTSPILTSTSSIVGTSNGDSEIELFIDDISSGLTDTATPGGNWSISVSNLEFGTSISVKATDTGLCPEESSSFIVTRLSIAPLILDEFCAGGSGVTELHGISSEPFNSTVTLYTRNSLPVITGSPVATGTVDANGNWSITGINLLAGTFAAVTNTDDTGTTSELESELSNTIQILAQTSDGSLDITTLIINEGDASLSGNGTNGNTIQLYIDDVAIDGFSDIVSGGTWEIAGLDEASAGFDILYPGGQVAVTSAEPGKCESDIVESLDVIQCRNYSANNISLTTGSSVCVNQTVSLSFDNSEEKVYYQLYTDAAGTTPTGSEVEGDGGTINLTSDPLATDITKLYLKAERIGVDCDLVFSANFNLSVKGNPALTFESNTIGLCDDQTTGTITYTEVTNGPFLSYSIDFDAATESVGFTDLINAAASSQITFDVPANAPNGTYAGTLTVANSDDATCASTDYSISLKIIENSISFENSTSPTACDANDGVIEISGLTPDVFYTLNFDLDGSHQSVSAEATDDGSYRMTNLDQGTYQNFVAEVSGCSSNTLQDPITLSDPSVAAISISDNAEPTNCLNDDGFILLSGMGAETDYSLTYSTNGNPLTYGITSDTEGLYRVDQLPNGIYSDFQVERLNCLSDMVEEPLIFVCGESLYNTPVVTPNGDGFNDIMEIEGIEAFPNNKVSIFNRWGNLVWKKDGYLNDDTGFGGEGNSSLANGALTDGTYFIVIDKGDGSQRKKNFVVIKR